MHAASQNYEAFYEEEILYRQLLSYPPVCHILAVMVYSKSEEAAESFAEHLAQKAKEAKPEAALVGPAPAGIRKINDIYREVFMLKASKEDVLITIKDILEAEIEKNKGNQISVMFDFDPINPF